MDPGLFVVPVEAVGPNGVSQEFLHAAREQGVLPESRLELLSAALVRYWQRSLELYERDPQHWFLPRAQHICIVRRGHNVRPYFQPIHNSSWLLYDDDFDSTTSSVELATYLLFHAERMGWRRQVLAAFEENLPYWLVRTDDEVADFRVGCLRSTRPDAVAWRALADALQWLRTLHHSCLRPPALAVPGGFCVLGTSNLLAPRQATSQWEQLRGTWQRSAETVVQQHYRLFEKRNKKWSKELCRWLEQQRPDVLLVGQGLEVLWDPERPKQTRKLQLFFQELSPAVAESLRSDLEVIDGHSRRFRKAICAPFPEKVSAVEPGGLCFLWPNRAVIAYRLCEPGMDRLRLPAPPYERLMLGARTMHEWGHLAAAAGWVGVPPERMSEWNALCLRLEDLCMRLVRDSPAHVRATLSAEVERLEKAGSVGRGLAEIVYTRMEDYRANVVARDFLSRLELETYVRNNVTCLRQSMRTTALFQRFVRYAYEFQYLLLLELEDPWSYLCTSTWFDREYWSSGVVSRVLTETLFACVTEMCALQQIDRSKLATPA